MHSILHRNRLWVFGRSTLNMGGWHSLHVPYYRETHNLFSIIISTATGQHINNLGRVMRKPDFSLCENKGADQLCSNCTADQHLCFCYISSSIRNLKLLGCFCDCTGWLCWTWSETPKTVFSHAVAHLIYHACFDTMA